MNKTQVLSLQNSALQLRFDPATEDFEIRDHRTDRYWRSIDGLGDYDVQEATAEGNQLVLQFRDPDTTSSFTCRISLEDGATVAWQLDADDPNAPFENLHYPPAFRTEMAKGMMLFCDRSAGNYISQRDDFPNTRLTVYGNTKALDMPWFGIVDDAREDGVMILFETPVEGAIELVKDNEGLQWPQVSWFDSFNTFAYSRRAKMVFTTDGGYVRQSAIYRDWVKEQGLFKTLKQKRDERPLVERLKGAMVAWGADGLRFAEEAYAAGVRRMIINGRFAPQDMQRMNRMGYLTSEYDNYSDIREGPLGMTFDNVQEAALREEDGTLKKGWLAKDGTQYYQRTPSVALRAAKELIPPILAKYPYTARFLDVHSGLNFFEDYNPDRLMTRRDDMKHRQALYAYINELDLVTGGEHAKTWSAPYLDYAEGLLSGSFWWEMDGGHLIPITSRDQILPRYLEYGINPACRLPIWPLTNHDALVMTWYWGDSSGYYHDVAPELSTRKDLFTMLYGGVPLVWLNHLDYGWDRHRERLLETYYLTCRLHERLAFDAMTSHQFLSDDRLLQRADYDSGAFVIVNFAGEPRTARLPGGQSITLAKEGFYAQAGDLRQERTVIDGQVRTIVTAPDFWYVETSLGTSAALGPFSVDGRLVAYKMPEGEWHVRIDRNGGSTANLRMLAPDTGVFRAAELDSRGRMTREVPLTDATLVLPATDEARLYAVFPNMPVDQPLIMPAGGNVTSKDTITLSVADTSTELFYTLDGSEPTRSSARYTEPIQLSQGSVVRARGFHGDQPVGSVAEAAFDVERVIHETAILRGDEAPVQVSFPVGEFDVLEFTVSDAGDGPDFDQATLGDAAFVAEDGTLTYLGDLEPMVATLDSGKLVQNADSDGHPIQMNGRTFEHGIWVHAQATVAYRLDRKYKHFQAWLGVPDATNKAGDPGVHNGSVRFTFVGASEVPDGSGAPTAQDAAGP